MPDTVAEMITTETPKKTRRTGKKTVVAPEPERVPVAIPVGGMESATPLLDTVLSDAEAAGEPALDNVKPAPTSRRTK